MNSRAALGAFALVGTFAVAGCASVAGNGAAAGIQDVSEIAGDWQLVSGADAAGALDLDGATVTLSIDGDSSSNSAGGTAACNTYGSTLIVDGGAVRFTDIFQTEMACLEPGLMELESRYLQALATVDAAERSGDLLVLSGEGVELEFEPVPPVPADALIGTTWMLESLGGESGDDSLRSVSGDYTLTLRDDGTFEAVGGCPPYEGRFEIGAGEVNIVESGIQGDVACLAYDPVQEHVMQVLEGGFRVAIDGDQLTVTNGDLMLVYRAG